MSMKSRFNLKCAAETACVQNDRVVMLILALPIRLKGTEPCERLESRVNLSLTPQSSHIPGQTPEAPLRPNNLTEEPWTLQEFIGAVEKLKLNKSADECGLVAGVFRYIPTSFAAKIVHLYNDLLSNGHIPSSWRRTLFTMLAKHRKSGAGHGLSADCLYTIVLQNFCLHDTAQNTAMSRQPPARRTTWFPCWTTFGRTFAHRQPVPRKDLGRKHASVDLELGLVKGI